MGHITCRTRVRTISAKLFCLTAGLTLAVLPFLGRAATPTFTPAEQEVIEALLQQDAAVMHSKRLMIIETASIAGLRLSESPDKFAIGLRRQANDRLPAFKEALEDFIKKATNDAKIVFPTNAPARVELVSADVVSEIFSKSHDAKPNGWDRFYERFAGSSGMITISRVGIDSKGTVAIIYLGQQSRYLAGSGRIRVLKRYGKRWVLSDDRIGPEWVS